VTVPPPVPVLATLNPFWTTSKLAVTELAEPMVTVQGPFPLHAPDQPVNVDVPPGAAVSVTTVPLAKLKEHVGPQLIPEGDEVTVPSPVPVLATFNPFWTTLKLAVTELAAFHGHCAWADPAARAGPSGECRCPVSGGCQGHDGARCETGRTRRAAIDPGWRRRYASTARAGFADG